MVIKSGTKIGNNTKIVHKNGFVYDGVMEFNTKTKEVLMEVIDPAMRGGLLSVALCDAQTGSPITVKTFLKNAIAIDMNTGLEIK